MKPYFKYFLIPLVLLLILFGGSYFSIAEHEEELFVSYQINPNKGTIKMFWKDDKDQSFQSIQKLKNHLERKNQKLIFAMNGGMYEKDNSPKGLYIENYKQLKPLDKSKGSGNFYLMPNGVFYINSQNKAVVCKTEDFPAKEKIKYATQSGPMLVIDGRIHHQFKKGSQNLNIRNGVGVLPDGEIIFAMSKNEISLYDFAEFFKNQGCGNALYLDGFVSRTYLPEKNWVQTDGNFGVIITVTQPK